MSVSYFDGVVLGDAGVLNRAIFEAKRHYAGVRVSFGDVVLVKQLSTYFLDHGSMKAMGADDNLAGTAHLILNWMDYSPVDLEQPAEAKIENREPIYRDERRTRSGQKDSPTRPQN